MRIQHEIMIARPQQLSGSVLEHSVAGMEETVVMKLFLKIILESCPCCCLF